MKESFEKDSVPYGGIGIPQRENGIPSRGNGWNSLKMESLTKSFKSYLNGL